MQFMRFVSGEFIFVYCGPAIVVDRDGQDGRLVKYYTVNNVDAHYWVDVHTWFVGWI